MFLLYVLLCVCVSLCMAVSDSGRVKVLLSPPCLARPKMKQGHCWGCRTYGRMSHTFLVLCSIERTEKKHCYVLKTLKIDTLNMFYII